MASVYVVVMGRLTFESVIGFGRGGPYPRPGLMLSSRMSRAPDGFGEHVSLAGGTASEVVAVAKKLGYSNLYLDGGKTIQGFLRADLIDEMILSEIPILLGGGERLFGDLAEPLGFELVGSEVLLDQIVRKHLRRKRR